MMNYRKITMSSIGRYYSCHCLSYIQRFCYFVSNLSCEKAGSNLFNFFSRNRKGAGENVWIRNNPTISQNLDLSTRVPAGFYTINDVMRDVANSPINRHYSCILLSSGTHDLLISVDAPCIYSRFTEGNKLSWNKII